MKRLLGFLAIVLLSLSLFLPAFAADTAIVTKPADAKGSTVRMRQKPDGKVIVNIPFGTEVEVLDNQGEWTKISFDGRTGWMMSEYLSLSNSTPDWRQAYASMLDDIMFVYPDYQYNLHYALYDIDEDSIPEMFVKVGTCEADYSYRVFTFPDGSSDIEQIGTLPASHASICGIQSKDSFLLWGGHMGYEWISQITLSNYSFSELRIFDAEVDEYHELEPIATYELNDRTGLNWSANPLENNQHILDSYSMPFSIVTETPELTAEATEESDTTEYCAEYVLIEEIEHYEIGLFICTNKITYGTDGKIISLVSTSYYSEEAKRENEKYGLDTDPFGFTLTYEYSNSDYPDSAHVSGININGEAMGGYYLYLHDYYGNMLVSECYDEYGVLEEKCQWSYYDNNEIQSYSREYSDTLRNEEYTYEYNNEGQKIVQRTHFRYYSESGKLQSKNNNIITTYEYDANGNLVRENYRASAYSYYTNEYEYEFDEYGNIIKKTTYKDGKLERWTEYKYQRLMPQ